MATESVKIFCVYKHTSPSGKIYIGQTCQSPKQRWRSGKGYKHNQYLCKAIDKYGWDSFKHEIVCSDLTDKEADWLEKYLISYYIHKQVYFHLEYKYFHLFFHIQFQSHQIRQKYLQQFLPKCPPL